VNNDKINLSRLSRQNVAILLLSAFLY